MKIDADVVYGFTAGILHSSFDSPQPTPRFHYEMWEACTSDHPQVAIAAPRGHAKSTAITLSYVLAEVLFRSSDYVLIVSDTETQSINFLNDIKAQLQDNQELRSIFNVGRFYKDAEKTIVVELKPDNHKFRITACSSGQSLRGLKWHNRRPNLIVCDDLENDEIVLNQDRREKFRAWFLNALLPTLSDYGKIRVVGTILHFDSLLERLMPPSSGPQAEHTYTEGLKTISKDPSADWLSIKYRAHTDFDDFTDILWPEKFNEERLKRIRKNYLTQNYPEGYSQEYLNYPIAESNAYFRKQDFIAMDGSDYDVNGSYYVGVDLAISLKERADYTAIVICKLDYQNILHVVDVRRLKIDSKEIVDELINIQLRYNPEMFIFESGQIEKAIGPFLVDRMYASGVFLNIEKKTPSTDKRVRARPIQGRMRMGGVRFDKNAEWYSVFEQELTRFDRGEHDDQVDAFAYVGMYLQNMTPGLTEDEYEEEQNYEEYYNSPYFEREGMNGTTGY